MSHLKIIEDFLVGTLFHDYEMFKEGIIKQEESKEGKSNGKIIMQELGLDQAFVAHKAFLLALIKAQKIINDNMFKVLHEFKMSAKEFDNECIYCKYSQYALRESSKAAHVMSQQNDQLEDSNRETGDVKVVHLIKMF
mmetsp:Transcript_33811/g.32887  ORF Transcript_33811/g.32887 Transcript_33811/m.32887 type:complete len:138 (-) Transcript_33811:1763-2176(-)